MPDSAANFTKWLMTMMIWWQWLCWGVKLMILWGMMVNWCSLNEDNMVWNPALTTLRPQLTNSIIKKKRSAQFSTIYRKLQPGWDCASRPSTQSNLLCPNKSAHAHAVRVGHLGGPAATTFVRSCHKCFPPKVQPCLHNIQFAWVCIYFFYS